ncbi:MAG: hypothetical protein JSV56_02025 [Methanomassiliicoccales archaeon]|nr:MAG: hypothetical protein JSV56_02025 [Methanomassiliicoccales archaeon]
MPDLIGNLEKRLITTREKIRTVRRDITGGVVEDKVKDLGKRTFDELDKDLDGLHQAVVEGRAKAKDKSLKLYEGLEADISAARTKLNQKRMDITGGVGEEKAKEAAGIIKERGALALKEIEEDIARIAEKLREKTKEQ